MLGHLRTPEYMMHEHSKVRCASVLKPIYAQISYPYYENFESWHADASLSVSYSNNDATDRLVETIGGVDRLTDLLNFYLLRVGISEGFDDSPATWGRFLMNHETLNSLYRSFLLSNEEEITRVIMDMMMIRGNNSERESQINTLLPSKTGWDAINIGTKKYFSTLFVSLPSVGNPHIRTGIHLKPVYNYKNEWEKWHDALHVHGAHTVLRQYHYQFGMKDFE